VTVGGDVAVAEVELPPATPSVEQRVLLARATTRARSALKKSTDAPRPFHQPYSTPPLTKKPHALPLVEVGRRALVRVTARLEVERRTS
jgi:hypothetical protein